MPRDPNTGCARGVPHANLCLLSPHRLFSKAFSREHTVSRKKLPHPAILLAFLLSAAGCTSDKAVRDEFPRSVYDMDGILAYVGHDQHAGQIHIMVLTLRTGETNRYPVTADIISGVTISPDGQTIACAVRPERSGHKELGLLSMADTSFETRLSDNKRSILAPKFSPDGAGIAFYAAGEGERQRLGILNLVTDSVEYLNTIEGEAAHPCWDPTGTKLAFGRTVKQYNGREEYQICVIDLSSRETEILIVNDRKKLQYPAYSPDGTMLLYLEILGTGPADMTSELFVYDFASKRVSPLYKRGNPTSATWVGGDSLVAFGDRRYSDNSYRLHVYNYLTHKLDAITPEGWMGFAPAWKTPVHSLGSAGVH